MLLSVRPAEKATQGHRAGFAPASFPCFKNRELFTSPRPWFKKKRYLITASILGLWMVALAGDETPPESPTVDVSPSSFQARPRLLHDAPSSTPTSTLISEPTPETKPAEDEQKIAPITAPMSKPKNSNCDSNYSGACVPIASDVDCTGGSGNGPAYVSGPVL